MSCLITELNKIGFNLRGLTGVSDLENLLYPHYVGHPLGIGKDSCIYRNVDDLTWIIIDLHESTHFERGAPYVEVSSGAYIC